MSETSATSTTSFIDTSTECVAAKPPLSSDSSIDSGFSAMTTNDSINSANTPNRPLIVCNQRRQDSARKTLSMLPPQPLVPPPPPPMPPPTQLQQENNSNNMYETSQQIYDKRAPVIAHYPSQAAPLGAAMNNLSICSDNYYATYATQSSQSSKNNSPRQQINNQTSPSQANPFQQTTLITKRSSSSSLESAASSALPLMPMNVKSMLLHGLPSEEVMRNWLASIQCEEHIENFTYHGYDIHLVTRMTPQDLAAIGCKSPALRKRLLAEIRKLNLDYEVPEYQPTMSLEQWLESLKLSHHHAMLVREGYDTVDKACKLTWEDLEEIGIVKLGHQKRLLLGIERIERAAKQQEDSQNDSAIYDVHPNHRVSLNGGTIGRVRSGLFQTRSGANLDHRGLPIATVMPALKHVNGTIVQAECKPQSGANNNNNNSQESNGGQYQANEQIYDSDQRAETMKLSELTSTMRRNLPPLPPVRTNSLKIIQGNNMQPIYGTNYDSGIYGVQPTNSTSFLRTPKLGTLTATTNKMLASGGHIQTIPTSSVSSNRIVPIREAPLPPTQHHLPYHQPNPMIQSTIPEKIDEESQHGVASSLSHHQQNGTANHFPSPPLNCDGPAPSFINVVGNHHNQLADANEFPPPPPSEP